MLKAPLYDRDAEAPEGGNARWATASDGVRLRYAWWDQGKKGTVLFFPGRTEFVEKYGRAVGQFAQRGYASVVIDWRGQGLSDRLAPNRLLGHVGQFGDYQLDVAAVLAAIAPLNLPKPYYLCAHSMGGAIALRAIAAGLPVARSLLASPMFGMIINPLLRPIAQAIASGATSLGLGAAFAPGTGGQAYIDNQKFEANALTSDRQSYAYMTGLVKKHPGLGLGGPSIHWVHEALVESRGLMKTTPPDCQALCILGSDESVIDKRDCTAYMARWPKGELTVISGARHELMMETPDIQHQFYTSADGFFSG